MFLSFGNVLYGFLSISKKVGYPATIVVLE